MSSARDEILQRIRTAHTAAGAPEPIRRSAPATERDRAEVLDVFVRMTEDYRAVVERCTQEELPGHIARTVETAKAARIGIPPDLDERWTAEIAGTVVVDDGLSTAELDTIDAVVTGATVGIADTGTIVLDHSGNQGRRALSLVPDMHVCVVLESQVVADVPTAVRGLRPSVDAHRALTWISGPSATSDIELSRVEGVHGPRTLHVILVAGA
ncbi:LutC/YkgG family protein [Leekyejoonella antrihumi]|uniref:Lactate utilization protein C n=1 Tax=Leekyejoonella antrihumi TaxID=1660198 RepID=A0A563E717_9MICO|nr:lactate utilization protein C [Leekyejoonella antrihumi]TWP37634.1 lactate utilization protein C [Leekyejoonella antrihumi]